MRRAARGLALLGTLALLGLGQPCLPQAFAADGIPAAAGVSDAAPAPAAAAVTPDSPPAAPDTLAPQETASPANPTPTALDATAPRTAEPAAPSMPLSNAEATAAAPLPSADGSPAAGGQPPASATEEAAQPDIAPAGAPRAPVAGRAAPAAPEATTSAQRQAPASAVASAPDTPPVPGTPVPQPPTAAPAPAPSDDGTAAAADAATGDSTDSTDSGDAADAADQGDSAGAPAAAAADEDTDQHNASTIELLDEDNRLDHTGEEGDAAAAGDTAEPGTDSSAAPGSPEAAAALTPETPVPAPAPAPSVSAAPLFPSSPGIEKQKAFWIKIFTHYNSDQGVLHDGRIALPVYKDLDLTGMRYRAQRHFVRNHKRVLRARLRELAAALATHQALTPPQRTLQSKLPPDSTPHDIREFAANVRFQRGLADRFKAGLIRSGALLEPMKAMLARYDVPPDLVYLPHVESSFNNATRSKFGASGIWQFTRGTGRIYMKVGYELDERLDPIIASQAAAKFLRQNYERLGNWPLAITAYNHGPQSLERITKRMHSRDLGVLIKDYDGRLFKFASKNFYAEFLAARQVAQHYERYFGPLELEPTLEFAELKLPWNVSARTVADALDIALDDLRELNPALRHPVWSGSKYIPAGYKLRIPPDKDPKRLVAAIPDSERHATQKRSITVRVARGDTLYSIGRRNGIPWRNIALANNITSSRRLRPGQRLILPWDGVNPPPAAVAKADDGASPAAKPALAGEHIVERLPVVTSAPWRGGAPPDTGADPLADRFQELRVVRVDPKAKEGEIVAAYGETVGKYATWAEVTPREVRRLNDLSRRNVLRPGETYLVPLDGVSAKEFEARRMDFHREREQSFFAEYDIKEKVKIEVQRGQSPWNLAQQNNVPMWLFYRENPHLLTEPLRVGMQVILPVVQAGGPPAR